MTAIRETCACRARIRIEHSDSAPIAAEWRATHPCDRRGQGEREVVKGGQVEIAYTERERSDSDLHAPRLGLHATAPVDSRAVARRSEGWTA